jgi:hypothetical protein
VERFGWGFDGGLGGEAEIMSLFLPVMRQVFAQSQQPARRQRVGLRIYAAQIAPNAPKRWPDGSLSIFGATAAWNVKTHDASHALSLARVWLKHYAKWRKTGEWPERTDAR